MSMFKLNTASSILQSISLLVVLLCVSAKLGAQPSADQTQVNQTLNQFHLAASKANFQQYFNLFAKEAVFIGTDASERWTLEEFQAFTKPYFDRGQGWTYIPRNRNVTISEDGNTAWFDELLDNESYGECRGSGVLVKTKKGWKVAQYNLHFPIPNDLAKSITQMIKEHNP